MNDFMVWVGSIFLITVIWFCVMLLKEERNTTKQIIILITIICVCVYAFFAIQPTYKNNNNDVDEIDPTINYPRYIK